MICLWRPIDTEFYVPRVPVGLIALPDSDVPSIRAWLESLNCVVHVHWIGTPSDFLKVVSQGAAVPRYLLIDGHGSEEGLHFGSYGEGIDTSMLVNGYLPPDVIRGRADLPGCTVVNLTCAGGTQRMAEAFLAGKAQAYIGSRDYVDGFALDLFLHNFVYNITMRKLSDRDAWYRAVADTDHEETDTICFYHADGKEERFIRQAVDLKHA